MLNLVIKVNKHNHRILPSFYFFDHIFFHSNWGNSKTYMSLTFSPLSVLCLQCNYKKCAFVM